MKYDKSSRICQNCKMHKNKPSRCTHPAPWHVGRFVNRKAEACPEYVYKHGVQSAPKVDA